MWGFLFVVTIYLYSIWKKKKLKNWKTFSELKSSNPYL